MWTCAKCTFINENDGTMKCFLCESLRDDKGIGDIIVNAFSDDNDEWTCHLCTLKNPSSTSFCQACETQKLLITEKEKDPDTGGKSYDNHKKVAGDLNNHGKSIVSGNFDSNVNSNASFSANGDYTNAKNHFNNSKRKRIQDESDWPSLKHFKASDDGVQIIEKPISANNDGLVKCEQIKMLIWNVWFEPVYMKERMEAIGRYVEKYQPDVIGFQEVTPKVLVIFKNLAVFKPYLNNTSDPVPQTPYFTLLLSKYKMKVSRFDFKNSIMGRDLAYGEIKILKPIHQQGKEEFKECEICFATTHLESPIPPQMYCAQRKKQVLDAFNILEKKKNVIFGGDVNWNDQDTSGNEDNSRSDNILPIPSNWSDVWLDFVQKSLASTSSSSAKTTAKPKLIDPGFTYDGKLNQMLSHRFRNRLDRMFFKSEDLEIAAVELIGKEKVGDLKYEKRGRILPVFPSDHFGLLCTFNFKSAQ